MHPCPGPQLGPVELLSGSSSPEARVRQALKQMLHCCVANFICLDMSLDMSRMTHELVRYQTGRCAAPELPLAKRLACLQVPAEEAG